MKTHRIIALAMTLVLISLAALACKTGTAPSNANGGGASSNANANGAKTATTPAQTTGGLTSPTAAFKAFYEAARDKNAAAMRKTLSKSTIVFLETGAKAQNKSFEEAIQDINAPSTMPETRGEKIEGETATLEAKDDATNRWETVNFVKEDGEWKVALDKGTGGDDETDSTNTAK